MSPLPRDEGKSLEALRVGSLWQFSEDPSTHSSVAWLQVVVILIGILSLVRCVRVVLGESQSSIEIKLICILLGFLKSGFIPHLSYQTHCPPVEALALKRNIVNLLFDSQDLAKSHLRGKQERRKRNNPLGPIVPPIAPEENTVYTGWTQISQI